MAPRPRATQEASLTGTWGYQFGTLTGAGKVTGAGRAVNIILLATGADGSVDVNGGAAIALRQGIPLVLRPRGTLVSPDINWHSGTVDVLVESVQ